MTEPSDKRTTSARPAPKTPKDNPFRVAARTVVQLNRKVLEALKDK